MKLLKLLKRDPLLRREFAQRLEDGQPWRLLDLKLYLTRRCNLRCQMCNAWTRPKHSADELSTGEVCELIGRARELGLDNLKLFGGEPLLRPDLEEIVACASGLGVGCTLITNGTLLTKDRARALVQAGVAGIDLSLDAGQAGLHDNIRGVPGAWERAVRGLAAIRQAAQEAGRTVACRVNTVVMRQNYAALPQLVRACAGLGVDEIVLNPAIPHAPNPRAEPDHYLLSHSDILHYNSHVAPAMQQANESYRLARDPERVYIFGQSDDDIARAAQGRYVDRLQISCCYKPWYYMVVYENGDVAGCNTVKHPAGRIGNIRQTALGELWVSERYREFRARCRPPQFEECAHCCYNLALVNRQIAEGLVK